MMKNCEYQQIDLEALSTPAPTPSPQPVTDNGKEEEKTAKKQRRKWEVFQGKNRFCCDGRIIMARQSGVLPLTLGLILLTSVLFFIFDCPFLVQHLTVCIPVIGGALFVFVVITLVQTSFSDPGILPRATPDEAADVEKQIDDAGNTTYRPPPRTREVLINQQAVKLKYCFTCKMFRPPRTSHCSLCDNCVERFDHHCPWVGNCVGKRNYRFFYTFIVSLSFLTAFIFGCVTTHLALRAQDGKGLVFALQESPGSAVELVICFFSVWSILGLSGFHTYLVASNLTTNEDIKGSWTGKSGAEAATNPYSHRNIFVNCCSVLCGPMPPSLIDRRGFLSAEEEAAAAAAPQATSREVELPVLASKKDINVVVRARLEQQGVTVRDVKLNGSAASHVLHQDNGLGYKDLDLIFGLNRTDHKTFQLVKDVVLGCLVDFLPEGVCRERISPMALKDAYVQKLVKVCNDTDRWSLISLSNNTGKNVELKFVDTLRRQFEFSVDSFQINLDSLLLFDRCSETPMSEAFHPTVQGESMYGDVEEALGHLRTKTIATRSPEEIRGGGLLKYCHLLARGFRPASETHMKQMQRYMCSRFFIDFPDIGEQHRKLEAYLQNHFAGMEHKRYECLVTLYRVVDESTVCLMGHERRQTLALISALALRAMAEQNAIPALANITCYYQPAPYVRDVNFSNYYVAQVQSPMGACGSAAYQTWLPCS